MEIFETISAHSTAMKLPLYAVTVTAVPRASTPVLLIMHWHGFRRETPVGIPGVEMPLRTVPGSAVQINDPWQSVDAIDQAMLDAAWQLGAWDVERLAQPPWWRLGAPASETLACLRAFGEYPDDDGVSAVMVDAPDRGQLMQIAANKGYIRWMFRPRKGGLWEQVADEDSTLAEGSGRTLPCPVAPVPYSGRGGRTIYRLGRANRLIMPQAR